MKSKVRGLVILLAVIAAGCIYYFGFMRKPAVTELSGYLGGEKTGLFDDEEFISLMEDTYHIRLSYQKAGSLDMISADQTGRDYLFPSSQVALEMYRSTYGTPKRSEIIFNTPIVLYTHRQVADALDGQGLITDLGDGAQGVDMEKLAQMILDDTRWQDIGLSDLYGTVMVATTDPVRSNSGNMFAGLLANVLAGGMADAENVDAVLPDLQKIFEKSGYMESSSADLFSQFLRTGVGAKPIIAGYESQILEFSVEYPDDWEELKDDIVLLYPVPTVWSSHPYIALTDAGAEAVDALLSEDVQKIAWQKHGFRTGVGTSDADVSQFQVDGLQSVVHQVAQMPDAQTMQKIINALSQ